MSYEVGQTVYIYDTNRRGRGPLEGTVAKVGRKLVTVQFDYGSKVFRIEDGRVNDQYGHQWIRTAEERAETERRAEVVAALAGHRLKLDPGCTLSTDQLAAVAELLSGVSGTPKDEATKP